MHWSRGEELTTSGGYIEMTSRFSMPVSQGLVALAIRGAVYISSPTELVARKAPDQAERSRSAEICRASKRGRLRAVEGRLRVTEDD